jgi:hypothetical protein
MRVAQRPLPTPRPPGGSASADLAIAVRRLAKLLRAGDATGGGGAGPAAAAATAALERAWSDVTDATGASASAALGPADLEQLAALISDGVGGAQPVVLVHALTFQSPSRRAQARRGAAGRDWVGPGRAGAGRGGAARCRAGRVFGLRQSLVVCGFEIAAMGRCAACVGVAPQTLLGPSRLTHRPSPRPLRRPAARQIANHQPTVSALLRRAARFESDEDAAAVATMALGELCRPDESGGGSFAAQARRANRGGARHAGAGRPPGEARPREGGGRARPEVLAHAPR